MMLHVVTPSRVATVTTDAVAATARRLRARLAAAGAGEVDGGGIRTKAWAGLEVGASEAALVGACVSGDVRLGHVLLARGANGTASVFRALSLRRRDPSLTFCVSSFFASGMMVATDITATQCLHETSEQMKAKSEQLETAVEDHTALEILHTVKPLSELLQVSSR
jgi:hypothetical protein